jgi:hypothetical protein
MGGIMKRKILLGLSALLLTLVSREAMAQGSAIMTTDAQLFQVVQNRQASTGWVNVGPSVNVHTSAATTLGVQLSLECGLFTSTMVSTTSKNGGSSTASATADAGVQVRILINNQPASPGVVTYCNRIQTLTQTLSSLFTGLPVGATTSITLSTQLDLTTLDANSFQFALQTGQAQNVIQAQARLNTGGSTMVSDPTTASASFSANALVQKAALFVNQTNLINAGSTSSVNLGL